MKGLCETSPFHWFTNPRRDKSVYFWSWGSYLLYIGAMSTQLQHHGCGWNMEPLCIVLVIFCGDEEQMNQLIMVLFVHHKLILQTHMRSNTMGLDVWFFVGPFVYFHTSCVRTAKALVRQHGCAGSPEPLVVAYMISTIISWAGSNDLCIYIIQLKGWM